MKVARKLTAALILGIMAVMAVYAYVQIRQEVVLYEADRQRARQVALAWLGTLEAVWEHEGPVRARELVERANERAETVTVRLVGLDPQVNQLPRPDLTEDQFEALRKGQVLRLMTSDEAGNDWRHFYVGLNVGSAPPAAVEFVEPLEDQEVFIRTSHTAMLLATLAVILVSAAIVTTLDSWFVGRPLQQLRDKARRAGSGDFSNPLVLKQRDEIGDLARELNLMCDRLAEAGRRVAAETEARITALEQLRHTDRLATVGQLAAGVAHELGTPLSVVSTRAQLIASTEMPRPEVAKNAGIVVEQADRMTAIIQQLLDFSRRRGVKTGVTDLRHIVTQTLDLLSPVADKAHVTVHRETGDVPVLANVDPNQLQQSLANIVLNAIQATPDGGTLRVWVGTRRVRPPADRGGPETDYPCISVEDNGTGMSADRLARIFEPFYTTKPVGEGTGLGLAVAHGIVAEHGGWITVDSTVGRGSCFSIFLPPSTDAGDVAVA